MNLKFIGNNLLDLSIVRIIDFFVAFKTRVIFTTDALKNLIDIRLKRLRSENTLGSSQFSFRPIYIGR